MTAREEIILAKERQRVVIQSYRCSKGHTPFLTGTLVGVSIAQLRSTGGEKG
jgi:hypothetical protein